MKDKPTWDIRTLEAAKAFNSARKEVEYLESAEIANILKGAGITTTVDLDDDDVFKFNDFRELFKAEPVFVVRKAYKALRGGTATKQDIGDELNAVIADSRIAELRAIGIKVKPEEADTLTLLPLYLPGKLNDPITVALKKRFSDKPVIAFRDDGTVAAVETAQYVSDLEQGFPQRDTIMVDGKLTKLWAVGVKPDVFIEEDPLFPGEPLRNGYSLINHRNWSTVSHENRQLCRIIVQRGDIDAKNVDAVLRLLERAAKSELAQVYPEADLEYRELKKRDALPKLKVTLGQAGQKQNNPFGKNKTY